MKSTFVISLVAIAAAVAVAFAEDDPIRLETTKLEGTWQLVSAITDGTATDEEVVKKIRVVIKGGKHTVFFGEEAVAKEIAFTINPKVNPKTTDDTLPDGKIIRGIYKVDGDMLTSCVNKPDQDRPEEFASKPGSGHTLRVFKRTKP